MLSICCNVLLDRVIISNLFLSMRCPSELSICRSNFCKDNGVSLSLWKFVTEQSVHSLEWNSLCLGYQEEDKDCCANHQRCEE